MKEYYIDPNKSYLENRQRLVDEGHVMGLNYLPFTFKDLLNVEHRDFIYKSAKKKSQVIEYEVSHYEA